MILDLIINSEEIPWKYKRNNSKRAFTFHFFIHFHRIVWKNNNLLHAKIHSLFTRFPFTFFTKEKRKNHRVIHFQCHRYRFRYIEFTMVLIFWKKKQKNTNNFLHERGSAYSEMISWHPNMEKGLITSQFPFIFFWVKFLGRANIDQQNLRTSYR